MKTQKLYSRASEFRGEIQALYAAGLARGVYAGFDCLDNHMTVKLGCTTYLYGSPFSGKSEFWFDIMVSLTELYGWKHALFTPETGTRQEIAAELISKKCRKPFYKQFTNHITEDEMLREMDWLDEYFIIIDPREKDITIDEFFQGVDDAEKDYGIKIQTTISDPFNEFVHKFAEDQRQDLYIENRLGFIRRNAQNKNRHNAVITHCTDQVQVKTTDINGKDVWFYPPPSPRQVAGGQAWYRKAMNLVCVWRPPFNVITTDGIPAEENEVHIMIKKYKPKGTGKIGTIKLFYDVYQNRFYEKSGAIKRYAGPQIKQVKELQYEF